MMNKTRLALRIKLYENSKVVLSTTMRIKARARAFVEANLTPERTGRCRVYYNYDKDYWNEFEFSNLREFNEILIVDTEKDLIAAFA